MKSCAVLNGRSKLAPNMRLLNRFLALRCAGTLRDFLKAIESFRIPIVAGIWPLVSFRNAEFLHNEVPGVHVTPDIMERMRVASAISKEAGRDEGLKIARESLLEVRDFIQGAQVSAPFGNVKYALEVFNVLPELAIQ